jgi:hypothetical protein
MGRVCKADVDQGEESGSQPRECVEKLAMRARRRRISGIHWAGPDISENQAAQDLLSSARALRPLKAYAHACLDR